MTGRRAGEIPAAGADPQPLADQAAVDRLGADLRAAGYTADAVPDLLGPAAHAALARGERTPALRATADGSPLSSLIRLFLVGSVVPQAAAADALPGTGLALAVAAGVLEPAGAGVRAALAVRPHATPGSPERAGVDLLLVSDLDSDVRPGPVRPDHVPGLGAASATLARAVIRNPVDSALDLGTGCGIQALHLAGHSRRVVATDTNPRALALAAATARINGQHWELRAGSLFEPVADDTFDLIVSNPPFVVGTGELRFAYRDSGLAGDEACRRLVTGARDRLRPGGTVQLLANWIIREGADWRARVGEWVAASGCDAWVVQRDIADPARYVGLWLADAGESAGDPTARQQLADAWLDYLARERVSGIGMGLITLRRAGATASAGSTWASGPTVTLDEILDPACDLSGPEVAGFLARRALLERSSDRDLLAARFMLAESAVVETRAVAGLDGWTTVLRRLRRPAGPGAVLQLDEWGQALFGGCSGTAPLALQIGLLAAAHGLDEAALTAAMLPAIRVAVLRGVIEPAPAGGR